MKISIALSILILGVGLSTGFKHHQQLAELREDRTRLSAQAAKLGIPLASLRDPRITKRQREDRDKSATALTGEFAAFARDMELHQKSGDTSDAAFQKRAMEMMERLMALDPDQLKVVIDGLRADQSLTAETRANLVGASVMMLAGDHPAAALTLFTASADLIGDGDL